MNKIELTKYLNTLENMLLKYKKLEEELNNEFFTNKSFEELQKENKEIYKDLLTYENSYANPTYSTDIFGEELGKLLAGIYSDFRNLITYAFSHNIEMIEEYENLYKEISTLSEINYEEIKPLYISFSKRIAKSVVSDSMKNTYTKEAYTNSIFNSLDFNDERYLFKYGKYISENEIKLASFMKNYPKNKLEDLAKIIVEAYIRGFEKDGKDISLRHNVRVYYNIGQELMVEEIFKLFKENKLEGMAILADTTAPNKQYNFDHKFDNGIYFNSEYLDLEKNILENMDQSILNGLKDCSGILYIEKFGEIPFIPENKKEIIKLTEEQTKLSMEQAINKRKFIEKYIPEVERSFCIVAFPSPEIGEEFEAIYEDTCKINALDSKVYEEIQKTIIDNLDKGDYIRVKGQNGNETDIKVKMPKINNPEKETNYFNCTADVNIPLGEVFTSPQLEGTNGILHLKKVYLDDFEYIDLKLNFIDGYVKEYSCKNFADEEANKKYIEENLLFPHKSLPLGEFAIGTNTLAYVIAKKYDIVDKLPILIVEKMGPHFAIGDTCYSWAEDLPVYNPDGKEIIARDNSHSCMRKEDISKAYTNVHTDITLPYDELEYIKVVTYNKEEIDIIKNGRFDLEGTEFLNKVFE